MPKCTDENFTCQNPVYSIFDETAQGELKKPSSANGIANDSFYCNHVPSEKFFRIGDMDHNKFLRPIRGRMGTYHLSSEYKRCDDHKTHTMICKYVGMDLSRFRAAPSARLSHFPFEGDRAFPT